MAEVPRPATTNLCTYSRKCFIARRMLMWLYLCKRPQHLVRSKSPMSIPVPSPSSLKRNLIRAQGAVSASAKLRSIWGYPAPKLSRMTHIIWENCDDEAFSKKPFISCHQLQSRPKHKSFPMVWGFTVKQGLSLTYLQADYIFTAGDCLSDCWIYKAISETSFNFLVIAVMFPVANATFFKCELCCPCFLNLP